MTSAFARMPGFGAQLIDPKFCCCAVPLVNAGIYTILTEQMALGFGVGVMALTTPDVVGATFPNFAKVIFAITCFVVALCQPVGFVGIYREKTKTFKWYTLINFLSQTAAFSVAAALIVVSATSHNKAVTACEKQYFETNNSTSSTAIANSTLSSESSALCDAFTWADVGIMGGLWLLLLLVQAYFLYETRSYSTSQVSDHKLYHSVYSENPEAFTMSILRSSRYNPGSVYNNMPLPNERNSQDAWDPRASVESLNDPSTQMGGGYHDDQNAYGHRRMYSDSPLKQSESRYDDAFEQARGYGAGPSNAGEYRMGMGQSGNYEGYQSRDYSNEHGYNYGNVEQPPIATSRDPGPTPTVNQYYDGQGVGFASNGGLRRPEDVQGHPAEGMMGRKSPRR
ncbi:hypothetical protein M231_01763 [Tremella mesenterica]|uniref:MARVEL domain-containing protein n=1 Tax=Tremella mesenterica TaxID=5217 RepID=A0A4Q1BSB4_TREME|nr:hypothetical protein M231_01763 [Tremella mesenterica]